MGGQKFQRSLFNQSVQASEPQESLKFNVTETAAKELEVCFMWELFNVNFKKVQ